MTTLSASAIKPIDAYTVHRITSGQVVVDVQTAVKELVENSLDAKASVIEVKFKEYGLVSFEVSDNGTGISADDFETVALRSHTSKIETFEDLESITTFGFRGEALSALCSLAKVSIQTADCNAAPKGWHLEFDKVGKLLSKKICSRKQGTSIIVSDLFQTFPVRRKQFEKDYKKQFANAQTLLQAYGLISTNLRLTVSNTLSKGSRSVQFQTKASPTLRLNFADVFTPKSLQSMIDLDLTLNVEADASVLRTIVKQQPELLGQSVTTEVKVRGLISKPVHGQGRTSSDRQYYYINGRPFTPSKISKCINEVYRQYNHHQSPTTVIDFRLSPSSYDVNLEPNKRTVFLHSEGSLIESLRIALNEVFQPFQSTFSVTSMSLQTPLRSLLQTPSTQHVSQVSQENERGVPMERQKDVVQVDSEEEDLESGMNEVDTDDFFEDEVLDTSRYRGLSNFHNSKSRPENDEHAREPLFRPEEDQEGDDNNGVEEIQAAAFKTPLVSRSAEKDIEARPLSSRRTSNVNEASLPKPQKKQMTLSTTGARWNLQQFVPSSTEERTSLTGESEQSAGAGLATSLKRYRSGAPKNVFKVVDDDEDDDDVEQFEAVGESQTRSGSEVVIDNDVTDDDSLPAESQFQHLPLSQRDHDEPSQPRPYPSSIPLTEDDYKHDAISETRSIRRKPLPISLSSIVTKWSTIRNTRSSPLPPLVKEEEDETSLVVTQASLTSGEADAEAALSQNVTKQDFHDMEIVGQFNLGFIVTKRRRQQGGCGEDDLFIIDQHASDEKYNFERLQRDTKLTSQRLLAARVLNLPAAAELAAMDNLGILEANGFGITVDETAQVGQRVRLVAQPVSGSTTWGVSDLEELLHLIADGVSPRTTPRPSKTRSMFAMRACRSSVMIGTALSTGQMEVIVRHMGDMDEPWACPHGRPTMRWVSDADVMRSIHPQLNDRCFVS